MAIGVAILNGVQGSASKIIMKLPIQTNTLTWNNKNQTPTWDDSGNGKYTISVTAQKYAGTYNATVTPASGYKWWDGTTTAKTVTWTINRAAINPSDIYESGDNEWEPSSTYMSYFIDNNGEYNYVTADDGRREYQAGTHAVYIKPDDNHCWTDGSYSPRIFTWEISRKIIDIPTLYYSSFVYDGTLKNPDVDCDSEFVQIPYDYKQCNAGTYYVIFRLKDKLNTVWEDGTDGDKYIGWTITQATPKFKIETDTSILNLSPTMSNHYNQIINYDYDGDGEISITITPSTNPVFSYVHDPNMHTITLTALRTGSGTISIKFNAGRNYKATGTKSFTVNANTPENILVGRTFQDIKNIITAGNAANYFKVGDYMPVMLNGYVSRFSEDLSNDLENKKVACVFEDYEVYAFILGINHNSSLEGNNKVHFCLGMLSDTEAEAQKRKSFTLISFYGKDKPLLLFDSNRTDFALGSNFKNYYGWSKTLARYVLNGDSSIWTSADSTTEGITLPSSSHPFIDVMPSSLTSLINSQVKYSINPEMVESSSYSSLNPSTTSDKLWILSEYEILGKTLCASAKEANVNAQYDFWRNGNYPYFTAYDNNEKYSEIVCVTRSLYISTDSCYCRIKIPDIVSSNVRTYPADPRINRGITPCFTM